MGAGVATLATGSSVGNLTLADGSITDSSGAISFGDENLSTTGAVTGASLTDGSATLASGSLSGAADIDGSGDLTMGTITMTGFSVDADGDTVVKTIDVQGASTISTIYNGLYLENDTWHVNNTNENNSRIGVDTKIPKANVKTVASSGADYTSVKDAVDSISEGEKYLIKVANGTYTESSTIEISSASGSASETTIVIVGETEGKVFIQAGSTYTTGKDTDLFKITTDAEDKLFFGLRNITIRNCKYGLLANKTDGTASGRGKIIVYNCHFKNCGYDGTLTTSKNKTEQAAQVVSGTNWTNGGAIRIHDFKGITIDSVDPSYDNSGVEIAYCQAEYNCRGIRVADCKYVLVHHNYSHHNLDSGFYMVIGSAAGGSTTYAKVYNNQSKYNNNNGILLISAVNIEVYENEVVQNWNSGIQFWYSFNVTVKDNYISYNNTRSYNGIGNDGDAYGGISLISSSSFTTLETYTNDATNTVSLIGNTIMGNQRGRQDRSIGIDINANMDNQISFTNLSSNAVKKPVYIYNNVVESQELGIAIRSTNVPMDGSTQLYDINCNSLLSEQSFYIADTNAGTGQALTTNIRDSSNMNRLTNLGQVPMDASGADNDAKLWFINTNTKQFLWVESPSDGKLSLYYGSSTPIETHNSA